MFRIERRLVNLAGTKYIRVSADDEPEVGAEGDIPDAATSAEDVAENAAQDVEKDMMNQYSQYLREAEEEAEVKANEIIEEARDKAAMILVEARDEAEIERKRAWEEGYSEGAQEARRSYEEKLAEKMEQDDDALRNVLEEINDERERMNSELEGEIVTLSLDIVRKIIKPAEEELNGVFTSLIKNTLRQIPTENKIVIRVGSVEYERFFSSGAATFELESGAIVTAAVLKDVSLGEGDLIIDTDDVTINAGVESQLQYVKIAFERANQYEPDS